MDHCSRNSCNSYLWHLDSSNDYKFHGNTTILYCMASSYSENVTTEGWKSIGPTSQQGEAGALADASSPEKMVRFRPPRPSVRAQTQFRQASCKAGPGTRCQELAASVAGRLSSVTGIRCWQAKVLLLCQVCRGHWDSFAICMGCNFWPHAAGFSRISSGVLPECTRYSGRGVVLARLGNIVGCKELANLSTIFFLSC